MNRASPLPVAKPVIRYIALAGFCLLSACSQSRLNVPEHVFEAGQHQWGTVKNCDVLLEDGASVTISYAQRCRFFVSGGAELKGFEKGFREVDVYQAPGAHVTHRLSTETKEISNAREAWKERHTRFLPATASDSTKRIRRSSSLYGGAFYDGHDLATTTSLITIGPPAVPLPSAPLPIGKPINI